MPYVLYRCMGPREIILTLHNSPGVSSEFRFPYSERNGSGQPYTLNPKPYLDPPSTLY